MNSKALWMALVLTGCSSSKEDAATVKIELNAKYWTCTHTHVWHHDAVDYLKLSDSPAYDSLECDQWSAQMTDGSLGGGAVADKYWNRK